MSILDLTVMKTGIRENAQMNQSIDELIQLHDAVEAQAYLDMFAAVPADLKKSLGIEVRELAETTCLLTPGLPTPIFNRVIGLGNRNEATEKDIAEISTAYRDAGVKDWWLHVSPTLQNIKLGEELLGQGFSLPERKSWIKMVRDNSSPEPVPTDATLTVILSNEASALAEVICTAFEMPMLLAPWFAALANRKQWTAVSAKLNDKIVGGGFLFQTGKCAWLGAGGVIAEARGKHVHRALMTLRMQYAIDTGCTQLFTETGEAIGDEPNPSLRNMHACGFHPAYSRLNYVVLA